MSIVFYEMANTSLTKGEIERVRHQETPPHVGDVVSMGTDRLWIVLEVDDYSKATETIYIAHCEPVGIEPLPRRKWFWVEAYQEDLLYGEPWNLKLYIDSKGQYITMEMGCKLPQLRTVLPEFNVEAHTSSNAPWGVVQIDEYQPQRTQDLVFSAIYLCHCQYVPELAGAKRQLTGEDTNVQSR